MKKAATKKQALFRSALAALALLLLTSPAFATRYTPALANDLGTQRGAALLIGETTADDLAAALKSETQIRFPLFANKNQLDSVYKRTVVPAFAGTFRLSAGLEIPPRIIMGQKLASGGLAWEPRLNLRRIIEIVAISPWRAAAYARNRWYDPRNATWLSEDPIGAVDSVNLYAFVGMRPWEARDPMGLGERVTTLSGSVQGTSKPCTVVMRGNAYAGKCPDIPGGKVNVAAIVQSKSSKQYRADLNSTRSLSDKALGNQQISEEDVSMLVNRADKSGHGEFTQALARGMDLAKPVVDTTFHLTMTSLSIIAPEALASSWAIPASFLEGFGAEGSALFVPKSGTATTPWGTRDLATGKFTKGPRGGIDPVDDFIAHAKANGFDVLGKEVSVRTPFETRRLDLVLRDPKTAKIGGIEIKSSAEEFAKFKPEQFAADRYINQFGAQAVGENARAATVKQIDYVMRIQWPPQPL